MRRALMISALAGLLGGCGPGATGVSGGTAAQAMEAPKRSSSGGTAGRIALRDDSGKWVRLADLLGSKVVMVSFWATWCAPCMGELKHLADIQRRRGRQGLQVVAVNTDPPASQGRARSVARRVNPDGELIVLLDQESTLMRELNPRASLPYYAIFNRQGELVFSHQGYQPGDERAIEARLVGLMGPQ